MTKDLYEWRQSKLLKIEYGGEGETLPSGAMPTKYKIKEDMPFKEKFTPKGALESLKRLTPKGGLEEREGYKEFKAKETAIEAFESPEFLAKKEAFKEQALKDLDAKQLETRSKEMLREPTEATFPQATAQSTFESQYENIVFEGAEPDYEELGDFIVAENEWLKKGKTDLTSEELSEIGKQFAPGLVDAEISGTGMAGIPVGFVDGKTKIQSIKASPQMIKLSQELKLSPESFTSMTDQIDAKKFNQYDLTKTRAQELSNILESEGVVIPPGMTEEKTLELLSSFDKVPMGKYPVGTDQKEYRAFVDTLKSGSQNPDTFQSVVTDLTENTDQTIQSAIDGTYVPAVEDVSYATDKTMSADSFIEDEQAFLFDDPGMGTVESGAPSGKTVSQAASSLLSEKTWMAESLEGDPSLRGQLVDTFSKKELGIMRDNNIDWKRWNYIRSGKESNEFYEQKLQEIIDDPELLKSMGLEKGSVWDKPLQWLGTDEPTDSFFDKHEITIDKSGKPQATIPDAKPVIPDVKLEDAPKGFPRYQRSIMDEKKPQVPNLEDLYNEELTKPALEGSGNLASVDGFIPQDVDVPDAKPDVMGSVGKFGGKTLNALQTLDSMKRIGQTLTDEEASGADKAMAGTQSVKMLADIAAKKAGQETAAQIGAKALTREGYKQLSKEGVKMGGKAAVGTAAGGVIGGYTMYTEAGEAKESWEEGDYDEAILHGISSVSGGLQTAGAGMMLTGIGAPLGAVLYGVGTAASAISSGAQLLEGLFGGSDAPALPEVKIPKFNASRYLDSIRGGYAY